MARHKTSQTSGAVLLSISTEMYGDIQICLEVKRALNFRVGRFEVYFMGDDNQGLTNSSLAKAMVTTFHTSALRLRVTATMFQHSIVTLLNGLLPEVLPELADTMKHSPKMQQQIYNNAKTFGKVSRMRNNSWIYYKDLKTTTLNI